MERIFDAAMNGMLMLGTPVMFLLTLVYSCCLIGPWALMGNFIILLFYPIMGGIAGIIAKLRRQAVKKTDARVHLMAEVSVPANVRSVDIVRERFKGVQSSKPKHGNVCDGDTSQKALLEEANGEPEEALRDISLHITKGSLIGICGRVGSGKTSLLKALCGEMNLLKGDIDVNGNIAIATQQAWIFNATIRDNILFGLPYLKSRYDAVLDACCLLPDLTQFTSSDLSEIGDRGVTLSGGQRQRINLARALYSDRDIFLLDRWLNVGVRKVKKLDNVARSSVVVHLSTTLQGISVIRVFDCHMWFTKMYQLVNTLSVAHIVFHLASRWFTLRMELVGIMVAAAAFIVVSTRSSVTTGLAGLVLTSVFSVCTFIPFIMRLMSELSARLTSIERIHEYCRDLREEAPQHLATSGAPPEWPSKGEIVFEEVCLRYREGLPLVLHSVSFHVRGGHKVGLVGRTGPGKYSFLVSLMRLQELESGRILLDGVDISKLGLHQLRSSVAVIPQDPVLFQGTVRYNLDPHVQY
ncbi:multidrug resistance-associated protein 5 isoform X2 [Ixodes scapularis]